MKNVWQIASIFTLIFTFFSCGGNENIDDMGGDSAITGISISSNKFNIVLSDNESFTFNVVSNNGQDITDYCLFFVNNQEINSNTFLPNELGSYQIKAQYQEMFTNTITVNVLDMASSYFKHKVLVEDFTGTWCGWCTRISYAIELLDAQTHDVIPVAIHNNDIFNFNGRVPLEDYLGVTGAGYPYATINRRTVWETPQNENINQPLSLIQSSSPIGIKINSNLGSSSGTIDVAFTFKEDYNENLKYVVYVTENGLIADQKNYYSNLYGGQQPTVPNFVHNHTLRACATNIIGDIIPPGTALANSELEFNNLTVNYSSQDINKLDVIVFITDNNGNVLNAQIAKANQLKDYQYAQ